MDKTDLKKEFKELYTASDKNSKMIDVPEINFLMIDGKGHPERTPEFQKTFETLYPVLFTMKFALKDKGKDFAAMPPEGLYYYMGGEFDESKMDEMEWTIMIAVPGFVTKQDFDNAVKKVKEKKDLPLLPRLRFGKLKEGKCVQMMHVGPYAGEMPTIKRMEEFASENGYIFSGRHHEIYFSDPHRTAPEKMKTILRQPVKKK
jgi:hypothetical protein